MESTLHTVTDNELPILADWLKQYLPDSHKLYTTVCETIRGRWSANKYTTLGWPDIKAAAEGPSDKDAESIGYFKEPHVACFYSPNEEDAETLLQSPGLLDWTQTIIFQVICSKLVPTIEKVAKSKGQTCIAETHNIVLQAKPGDLSLRSMPPEFELRNLKPNEHTEYTLSTWPYARNHADKYVRECIRRFPTVGVFDRNGKCIGIEIGTEYSVGFLHVREECRGRGLGKIITSQLADKYFQDDLPVTAFVDKSNDVSANMHRSIGFRDVGEVSWIFTLDGENVKAALDDFGFKGSLAH